MPDYKLRNIQEGYFKVFRNFHGYILFILLFEFLAGVLPVTYLRGTALVMEGKPALQVFFPALPPASCGLTYNDINKL